MAYDRTREYYRIVYPIAARPRFVLGDAELEVLDLSEGGVRFRLGAPGAVRQGDEVRGLLRFRRGEEVEVAGVVVRVAEDHAAVRLEMRVPFRTILEEQRYLREHHRGMAW